MRTKRSLFSLGGLVAVLTLLLAGCGATTSTPVTLTFWYTESGSQAAAVKDLIIKFEQQNPSITINGRQVANTQAHDLYLTAVKQSKAPDVLSAEIGWSNEFAAAGDLYDITSSVSSTGKSDYLAAPLAATTYKGKIYGLPQDADFLVLYYNKAMLTAGGIATAPTTWDQFDAANKALTKNGKYGWAWQGSAYDMQQFLYSFGGGLINTSGATPQVIVNNANSIKGLTFFKQELIYAPKPDYSSGATVTAPGYSDAKTSAFSGFASGTAAMFMGNASDYTTLQAGSAFSADKSNLGVAAIPMDALTGNVARSPISGRDYVLYKNTAHPVEANQFIQFMSSASSQLYLATKNGELPTRTSVYQGFQTQATPTMNAVAAFTGTQVAPPSVKQSSMLFTTTSGLDANLQKYVASQQDAAVTAQNIAAGLQSLLQS